MKQNFSSDKPIEQEEQDRFQRYSFSRRIADTILQRENQDGIVIGIYGAWGEGKTSVLNFIEKELQNHESVLTLKLNPWRYNDEEALIKSFFKKMADVLGRELENKQEKLGSFMSKYGSIGAYYWTFLKKARKTGYLSLTKNPKIHVFLALPQIYKTV
jgi:predicted KAP-like P-loop ATPase